MKRKLSAAVIIIFIGVLGAFAQNDSLIKTGSNEDVIQQMNEFLNQAERLRSKNPEQSIEYAQKALQIAEKTGNYELQHKSEYLIGFAHYIQNDFSNALIHLDKSLTLSKKANYRVGEAAALNRMGNTYQLMGQYEQALEKYKLAMSINKGIDNKHEIARTLTNLGSIYRLYGNYELAINQHLDALSLYEGLQNNEGIAWSSLNIARLFKMMKNYQKSLEYVNKSLFIYQKIENEQGISTGVTLCLKEKGSIYYEMGNLDKAIEYSFQVLEINKGSGNMQGVANTYASLGKIYYDHQDFKKATDFFSKANQLKDSLNDNTEKASILRYLGRIHLRSGNIAEAEKYLKQSLEFAQDQNLKEEIKESYLSLSEIYEQKKHHAKALEYFKLYTELKDGLNNQKINELELQYEFDKKQRLLEFEQRQREAEQQAKIQKQKIYKWVFAAGFLFMLIFAYFIFKSYQRKKQTNIILTKQKAEIEEQRDEIEAQRDFVTKQRDQIAHQNTIITDSIEYARRIQTALFPQEKFMDQVLKEHFVFMKPKNIVSGDFYWVTEKNNKLVLTVSDCTGHGVPGAFMSMLGIAFLNEIVNKTDNIRADQILGQLRENIIDSLHQEHGMRGSKDGMDMAMCIIDKNNLEMEYAGAYNPVYIVRDGELIEIKADKMPIGIHAIKVDKDFERKTIKLESGDMLYLFSDGYVDQFGGQDGMKFKQKAFKELLIRLSDKDMNTQLEQIDETMKNWQGDYSQLDDMMIMGIRV